MVKNTFRRGSGVFVCRCCGRSTRTTHQPQGSDLCYECWELCGVENGMSDEGLTIADIAGERDRFAEAAVSRGGSIQMIKKFVPTLWA